MLLTIDYVADTGNYNYDISDRKTNYVDSTYVPDSLSIINDHDSTDLTIQAVDFERTTAGAERFITPAITVKAGETLDIYLGTYKKLYIRGTLVPWRLLVKRSVSL